MCSSVTESDRMCMQNSTNGQSKLLLFLMRTSRSSHLAFKQFLLLATTIPATKKSFFNRRAGGRYNKNVYCNSCYIRILVCVLYLIVNRIHLLNNYHGISSTSPSVTPAVTDGEWMHKIDSAWLPVKARFKIRFWRLIRGTLWTAHFISAKLTALRVWAWNRTNK